MGIRMIWAGCLAAGCLLLATAPLVAGDFPEWAYPADPKAGPFDSAVLKPLPGSDKTYTQTQIEDDFGFRCRVIAMHVHWPALTETPASTDGLELRLVTVVDANECLTCHVLPVGTPSADRGLGD